MPHPRAGAVLCALAICMLSVSVTAAAQVRVHYVPGDGSNMSASGPATVTTRTAFFGTPPAPAEVPVRPNQILTFRHPATGRTVSVPLYLPEGTPKIRYRPSRVVYDYGSDAIEVRFQGDGSVDVIYNSGFLRRW